MESLSNSPTLFSLPDLLVNCSIDAITAVDLDWKIIAWNTTAEQASGLLNDDVMGKHLLEACPYLSEDTDVLRAIERAFNGFRSFVPASGRFPHRHHLENHYLPLHDSSHTLIGVMNIMHDVAHRLKAERQLQQLNLQLEKRYSDLQKTTHELATFTYLTGNDIKEPIRHIYTAVESLIKHEAKQLSDSGKASFRRIQSSLSKMNLLLEDILSLSRINILQKPEAEVNLDEAVLEAVKLLEKKIEEKRVSVSADELCSVIGHRDQLILLFYHLLDNAIKFNKSEAPQIIVTCREVVQHEATGPKLYQKVSIKDNGIGFDPTEAEKIFNMFEKLHPKEMFRGSGMGLAIARKIMDSHDGFMLAESSPGHGADFHCFFPSL